MSGNATTNARLPCAVCNKTLCSEVSLKRHILRWHPTDWVNQGVGRQVTYYPCHVQGCDRLNNNTRLDFKADHLSMYHGIDAPSRIRTTDFNYIRRKRMEVLKQHILQEAAELNELNRRIRWSECFLFCSFPAIEYTSRHGLDVYTVFQTNPDRLPAKKGNLALYLQRVRNTRNQVGSMYTRPGVKDTRDGIADDLEILMGWP